MNYDSALCNISDARQTIEEARDEWIIDVLLALEIPESVIEMGYEPSQLDDYIYAMNDYGVEVILYANQEVDVYKKVWIDGETEDDSGWLPLKPEYLVAQWKTPEKIRRVEPDGSIYYEIYFNEWSIKNTRR